MLARIFRLKSEPYALLTVRVIQISGTVGPEDPGRCASENRNNRGCGNRSYKDPEQAGQLCVEALASSRKKLGAGVK